METASGLTEQFSCHCVNQEGRAGEHCVWIDNDQGPHFKGHDTQDWAKRHDIEWKFCLPVAHKKQLVKRKK